MSDYISREAALIAIMQNGTDAGTVGAIMNIPAADVALVVRGEWRHSGGDEWCCTNCGNVIHTEGSWERPEQKYCEECGAKMNGGKQ